MSCGGSAVDKSVSLACGRLSVRIPDLSRENGYI